MAAPNPEMIIFNSTLIHVGTVHQQLYGTQAQALHLEIRHGFVINFLAVKKA